MESRAVEWMRWIYVKTQSAQVQRIRACDMRRTHIPANIKHLPRTNHWVCPERTSSWP